MFITTVAKRKATTDDICTRPNKIVCSAVNNVLDVHVLHE